MTAVQEMLHLDFDTVQPVLRCKKQRHDRGRLAYLSGQFAEDSVARYLEARDLQIVARRWRGKAGEIDLICRQGACHVFVEVKQAATHADAALRLGRAQQQRICLAALEYCDQLGIGSDVEMRFDLVTVDALGRIEQLENAFGGCFH